MQKLRSHLLPRIYQQLLQEAEESTAPAEGVHKIPLLRSLVHAINLPASETDTKHRQTDMDSIIIHSDRIYRHGILHMNFTRYDVRRDVDIINPRTSRRDLMCLREPEGKEPADAHRFVYTRVLGIYHVNILYRGRGSLDLRKRRFDFLWIRRYQALEPTSSSNLLDRLQLLPLTNQDAVGFLDPANALRACHIIPRFAYGQKFAPANAANGSRIVSKLAKDQDDWNEYYVNRSVPTCIQPSPLWLTFRGGLAAL
jgi:hypothetical protein